jgi:hypothetical protein
MLKALKCPESVVTFCIGDQTTKRASPEIEMLYWLADVTKRPVLISISHMNER